MGVLKKKRPRYHNSSNCFRPGPLPERLHQFFNPVFCCNALIKTHLTRGVLYAILSKNNLKANHNRNATSSPTSPLYAILSKNNLKANHNWLSGRTSTNDTVCNLVKEQSESKSQLSAVWAPGVIHCMQSCQRTIWKQITTTRKIFNPLDKLYAILSKNNLKANHNLFFSLYNTW